jgi:hypothetical protein
LTSRNPSGSIDKIDGEERPVRARGRGGGHSSIFLSADGESQLYEGLSQLSFESRASSSHSNLHLLPISSLKIELQHLKKNIVSAGIISSFKNKISTESAGQSRSSSYFESP